MSYTASEQTPIAIVTPSYNQGKYIEQTIDSVLSQGYSNLVYVVIDGGSTDNSVEIIKKYDQYLHYWISEPDAGPWDAILKGVSKASGIWFNWLNSDDLLLPGSLHLLDDLIRSHPHAKWITGARLDIDSLGRPVRTTCPWIRSPGTIMLGNPFFPQDSTFMRRDLFLSVAPKVPPHLRNLFDTVLHRLLWRIEPPLFTTAVFSAMRWHDQQLTASEEARKVESHHPEVMSSRIPISVAARILRRLSSTRLHPLIQGFVRQLASYGALGVNDLKATYFNPWANRYVDCSVSDAIVNGDF